MTKPGPLPWIVVSKKNEAIIPYQGEDAGSFHAIFAARINLRPFLELKELRWGFGNDSLLEEASNRLRAFLFTQKTASFESSLPQRSLVLRCVHIAGEKKLRLAIVGKVCGKNPDDAHHLAQDYWNELQAVFPHDYKLEALETQEQFEQCLGIALLNNLNDPDQIIEIRRFTKTVNATGKRLVVMGRWHSTLPANELMWRMLANQPGTIMLNVLLQPTIISNREMKFFNDAVADAKQINLKQELASATHFAKTAEQQYLQRIELMYPAFLSQVHIISSEAVTAGLKRVIGAAFTYPGKDGGNLLGGSDCLSYEDVDPEIASHAVTWLEPIVGQQIGIDRKTLRLPYLADLNEAQALFRLPFPPEGGAQGVGF